jgi:hypothetical protein
MRMRVGERCLVSILDDELVSALCFLVCGLIVVHMHIQPRAGEGEGREMMRCELRRERRRSH